MKILKLVAFLIIVSVTTVFSQSVEFVTPTDTAWGNINNGDWELPVTLYATKTTGNPTNYHATKEILSSVGGTEYYYCWGTNCFPFTFTVSSDPVYLSIGDTNNTLKTYAKHKDQYVGVSSIKYCIYDDSNPSDEVCSIINYVVGDTTLSIAGDLDGNGVITGNEIAGDVNNNGVIDTGEILGDLDGSGAINGSERHGDANGNGVLDNGESSQLAGDVNGNGVIDGSELAGDVNGDGQITGSEILGDANGDGQISGSEFQGDINGDGINMVEFIEQSNNIKIYANNRSNSIIIKNGIAGIFNVEVYNMVGQLMTKSQGVRGGSISTLNSSRLQTGIYFVAVNVSGRIVKTQKIMIEN